MSTKMVYGAAAYEGLCRAVVTIEPFVGCTVKVASGTAMAITADGTVTVPSMTKWQTEEEFRATCAGIYHELCHAKLGSHILFADEVKKHGEKNKLFADCLNAVLDCADEMQITLLALRAKNRHVATELHMAYRHHYKKNVKSAFLPGKAPAHWQILATGIAKSRWNMKSQTVRFGDEMAARFPEVNVTKVYSLLWQSCVAGWKGERYRLVKIAEQIEKLLETLRPPEEPVGGIDGGKGNPGELVAVSTVRKPAGTEATADDGAKIAGTPSGKPVEFDGGTGGSDDPGGGGVTPEHAFEEAYKLILPVVSWIAGRMADDGASLTLSTGHESGSRIRNPARSDGKVFARWQTDDHAEGMTVAVVADKSGSMFAMPELRYADKIFGMAEAFAQGMSRHATVYRYVSAGSAKQCETFRKTPNVGFSNGDSFAMPNASKMLANHPGKRVIVILTDGMPDYPSQCASDCTDAVKLGCEIIAICMQNPACSPIDETRLRESIPHGTILVAPTVESVAIELKRVAGRL